ncbi:MAG: homoserine O-succinyltransferase [Chitinivibrionales bacterium]|nr:homoserine O-succinyltransferase [Chitinivibrionales bacterium]
MTIVVPNNYHIKPALERRRILCATDKEALREDIRALRIGILNIMPRAEKYEFNLLYPLGRSVMQIEPVWIRLHSHPYSSSNRKHLDSLYVPFEKAIEDTILDGLILTGAPVEEIPFEEVSYWGEIKRILKYARNNIASTLGICWGGLALAKYMGIDTIVYPEKLFGVFETKNLDRDHPVTGDMDDYYWCPQSRHSGIEDAVLERESESGNISLLAYAQRGGYTIFESSDARYLMHLGHPEYNSRRLIEEYERDMKKDRNDVFPPENISLAKPMNRWRGHRAEFFAQWIKFIHERTSY